MEKKCTEQCSHIEIKILDNLGKYYLINSNHSSNIKSSKYDGFIPVHVPENFRYASNTNESFLNIDEIRALIKNNLDKNFEPY